MIRKILAPNVNCWQSYLSCVFPSENMLPLEALNPCSTEHDDWQEKSQAFLKPFGYFFLEIPIDQCSAIPDGAIVGAHTNGKTAPHILLARVRRKGNMNAFEVEHDPSGRMIAGTPIQPTRLVLICRLDK